METKRESDENNQQPKNLLKCVRREKTKDKELANIPIGEKERKNWIKSRKADANLDMDFLPREVIYDYNNDESTKKMKEQLNKMNENLRKQKERRQKIEKEKEEQKAKEERKENKERVSLPITKNAPPEKGFFEKLWGFFPFAWSGGNNEEYAHHSDEENEKKKQEKKSKHHKRKKYKH